PRGPGLRFSVRDTRPPAGWGSSSAALGEPRGAFDDVARRQPDVLQHLGGLPPGLRDAPDGHRLELEVVGVLRERQRDGAADPGAVVVLDGEDAPAALAGAPRDLGAVER